MEFLFVIFILPVVLAGAAGFAVSRLLYNKMIKEGKKNAMTVSVIVFIVSFLIVLVTIFALIISNAHFGR